MLYFNGQCFEIANELICARRCHQYFNPMKNLFIIFIVILIVSCNSKKYKEKLQGLWVGSTEYNDRCFYVQFSQDSTYFYNYFSSIFSPYKVTKNKIYFHNTKYNIGEESKIYNPEYIIKNDSLFLISEKANGIATFYKSQYKYFLYEYLSHSGLKIQLPKIKLNHIIERSILNRPIFMGYFNNSDSIGLVFDKKQVDFSSLANEVKDFIQNSNELDRSKLSISLYIDQNIKLKDVKRILNVVGFAWKGYSRTLYFIVDNESKYSSHKFGIKRKFPYVNRYKIVPDDELDKKDNVSILDIDPNGKISFNNKKLTRDEFRKFIKEKIVCNIDQPEFSILKFDDNLSYGYYLKTLDYIYSIRDTLRNAYAFQTFGKRYGDLKSEEVGFTNDKVDFMYSDFVMTCDNKN